MADRVADRGVRVVVVDLDQAGPDEVNPAIRVTALGHGAWLAFRQGDYALATTLATTLANELLALRRERGDPGGRLAAYFLALAVCAGPQGGDALPLDRACLDICRELGECWETAYQLFVIAAGCISEYWLSVRPRNRWEGVPECNQKHARAGAPASACHGGGGAAAQLHTDDFYRL